MDIIIRVAVFAFLIEAIVEVLRPIWHKLDFTEDL